MIGWAGSLSSTAHGYHWKARHLGWGVVGADAEHHPLSSSDAAVIFRAWRSQVDLLGQPERNAHFSHRRACGFTVGATLPARSA